MTSRVPTEPDEQMGTATAEPERSRAVHYGVVVVLTLAGLATVIPLWPPLLLASWGAIVAHPLYRRVSRILRGRERAASALTVLLVLVALIPVVVLILSVLQAGMVLKAKLQTSSGGAGPLLRDILSKRNAETSPSEWVEFVRAHGREAMGAAGSLFGTVAAVAIGLFIFVLGFHAFLVSGRDAYHWTLKREPIPRRQLVKFADAFVETGRGLLIGVGLTAALQGTVATIGYFIIGVPQALVLGLATAFAALIPSFGTGLVWIPLSAGLFLANRSGAAVGVLSLGIVVSTLDNFIRPWLSRYGRLDLSSFVLLVAMLGGVATFGGFGLFLGPLLVRLAIEGWNGLNDHTPPKTDA